MKIGRRDLHARVEQVEKIVADDAFHDLRVAKPQADPEAVEFGAAEKHFALGLKGIRKFTYEIDALDVGQFDRAALPEGVSSSTDSERPSVAGLSSPSGGAIQEEDNDLLMRRRSLILHEAMPFGGYQWCIVAIPPGIMLSFPVVLSTYWCLKG